MKKTILMFAVLVFASVSNVLADGAVVTLDGAVVTLDGAVVTRIVQAVLAVGAVVT